MEPGRYRHWQADLVSVIIPVLELKRSRRLRYPLAKRRNINDLLGDLERIADIAMEIIVVCNSRDSELVTLVSGDGRIDKYCLNSVNVGVARGWNMGAMMAEGEFLCFINDDVELGADSLGRQLAVLKHDPGIGQVGPIGGMWPGIEPGGLVQPDGTADADAISGFMFLTRRALYDAIGGFDVAFTPAGCEEIDFSFAVRQAGFRCTVVPDDEIKHHGKSGVSSRQIGISYFGRNITTKELATRNLGILKGKWSDDE